MKEVVIGALCGLAFSATIALWHIVGEPEKLNEPKSVTVDVVKEEK